MNQIQEQQIKGSGFDFDCIFEKAILEVYKIRDPQASSWVELPKKYKNKKPIINIKNNDQYCFLWGISSKVVSS